MIQTKARDVLIQLDDHLQLQGILSLPEPCSGLILFAHGSGSSRFSSRNQFVATQFNASGLGTLLFDLLTPEEEQEDQLTRNFRFNILLLAQRLIATTLWTRQAKATSGLSLGYFGASTGAAAALIAAASQPKLVDAVVSRGGRTDLAGSLITKVAAPTLLIVGENDPIILEYNRQTYQDLGDTAKKMAIIPQATHLFEEPGSLQQVARLAEEWFSHYFVKTKSQTTPPKKHGMPHP